MAAIGVVGLAATLAVLYRLRCIHASLVWSGGECEARLKARIAEQEQTEASLRAIAGEYRSFIENSRDALLTFDPEAWKFLSGNPAAVRMFRVQNQEEFATYGLERLSCESQAGGLSTSEKAKQVLEIAAREGTHSFEWMHKRIDGEEFPATVVLTRMDRAGKMLFQATVRDVSAEKRAEADILRFKTVFDSASFGAAIADLDGALTYVNDSLARMHGSAPHELLGQDWIGYCADDQLERAAQLSKKIRIEGGFAATEIRLKHKDGHAFPALLSGILIRDAAGAPAAMAATVIDVSERNRVQDELRAKTAFLEAQVESSIDGILVVDRQNRKVLCNRRLIDLWNVPQHIADDPNDTALLKHVLTMTRNPKAFLERITYLYDHPAETSREEIEFKNGMVFDRYSSSVIGKDGHYYGRIWAFRDITAQKRAEEMMRHSRESLERYAAALETSNRALEESSRQAEAGTRAKSEFLANMSHEIRTPLTAILGYADLLLNEEDLFRQPEHWRQSLRTIRLNGEHLLGVINDILDLSKVESGKMEIEPVRCSPLELVAEVAALMRVRAEARQLKLETNFVGPVPQTVLTDPLRLRQVLINLVGNAIKFTERGEVRVTTRLAQDNGATRLRFDVSDTGIGMDEAQVNRLFQPFVQVDSSATRKFGGTGLGLRISQLLAEGMGGRIEVQSVLHQGSTFSILVDPGPLDGIPMLAPDAEPSAEPPPVATRAAADKNRLQARVLLAEDGLNNQRLLSFLLKKAGAEVTAVENGQLALDLALAARDAGQPFDVILMDMQMPVMDGYTATQHLREQGYDGPIIALTAHAMAGDRQKCLDAGCDDYTAKPVDRQRLVTTVARWAQLSTATRPNPEKPQLVDQSLLDSHL